MSDSHLKETAAGLKGKKVDHPPVQPGSSKVNTLPLLRKTNYMYFP